MKTVLIPLNRVVLLNYNFILYVISVLVLIPLNRVVLLNWITILTRTSLPIVLIPLNRVVLLNFKWKNLNMTLACLNPLESGRVVKL